MVNAVPSPVSLLRVQLLPGVHIPFKSAKPIPRKSKLSVRVFYCMTPYV